MRDRPGFTKEARLLYQLRQELIAARGEVECAEALCRQAVEVRRDLGAGSADGAHAVENAVARLVKTHRKYMEKLRTYHDALMHRQQAP